MNAPLWFILLPCIASILVYLFLSFRPRLITYLATTLSLFLAWSAMTLPLDTSIHLLGVPLSVSRSFLLFGRSFTFEPSMRPALMFLHLAGAALFIGSLGIPRNRRLLPIVLVVQSLFSASLFVQPFLFAAIFLLLAVTLLSLLLSDSTHPSPRGATRWIAFAALGMPFLLLAGSELSLRSDLPLDPARAQPIIFLLIIGFGLMLSFPPFHFWLPDVADDSPPYSVAVVLSLYVGAVLFFLLRFLDSYTWLRSSSDIYQVLRVAGVVMCVVGGIFALVQSHFGRMIGYLSMVNLGAILLGISVAKPAGIEAAMVMLATRGYSLIVWGFSFQAIRGKHAGDHLEDLRGRVSIQPFSCAAAILAGLCLTGLPGLLSFPGYWATLSSLAGISLSSSENAFPLFILIFSMSAGIVACLRFARVMLEAPIGLPIPTEGGRLYQLMVGFSIISFFLLGLLPQIYLPWIASSAKSFTNLMGM